MGVLTYTGIVPTEATIFAGKSLPDFVDTWTIYVDLELTREAGAFHVNTGVTKTPFVPLEGLTNVGGPTKFAACVSVVVSSVVLEKNMRISSTQIKQETNMTLK